MSDPRVMPTQTERVWCIGCFQVRELDRERRCVECGSQVKAVSWKLRTLPAPENPMEAAMTDPHCDTCGYSSAGLMVGFRCPFASCDGHIVVLPSIKDDVMQDVKNAAYDAKVREMKDRG